MKRLFKTGLWVCALMLPLGLQAGRFDVEKKKVIEKSYNVGSATKLSLKNTFGRVHVNSWNKNEISVVVEVIARRNSEERAQETLDKIDIQISESNDVISFATQINGKMKNSNSERFEINYEVNMPSGNPLEVDHDFGDTYLSDRSGYNDIKIAYGDLKIGRLTGETDMKISFSDGEINEVARGELILKYSDVEIDNVGIVRLENGFSDISIGTAETIKLESKYGELEIGVIRGLKGYVGFSSFSIDYLEKEIDLEAQYAGDFSIDKIDKEFSVVNLEGKFGEMDLNFEPGTNASFEVFTSFCEFDYDNGDVEINYQIKGALKSEFRGTMGNGKGGAIKIRSSYGDVNFD